MCGFCDKLVTGSGCFPASHTRNGPSVERASGVESSGISFDPVFSAGKILRDSSVQRRFSKNETTLGKSAVFVLTSGLSCNTCQIRVLTSVGFTFLSQDL